MKQLQDSSHSKNRLQWLSIKSFYYYIFESVFVDFTVCYQYFDNMHIVAYFLYKASVYTELTEICLLSDNTILKKKKKTWLSMKLGLFFFLWILK